VALLMVEGFDTYPGNGMGDSNFGVQLSRNWDSRAYNAGRPDLGGPSGPTSGRGGGRYFWMYSDGSYYSSLLRDFGTVYPTVIFGFSYWPETSTGNTAAPILRLLDNAGTEMGRLYLTASGGQLAYRNGSGSNVLTTSFGSGFTPMNSTWYTVEMKVTAGTSTGYVEIRVNGTPYSVSNVNTVGTALASGMRSLGIGATGATSNFNVFYFDHLVVMDATGSTLNDFQGDLRIKTLLPSAAGAHSDWVPTGAASNWGTVSESGLDQDTTYNLTSTPGAMDSYALSDITPGTPVYGVAVSATLRKDDASLRQGQLFVRLSGSDLMVGSPFTLASDYTTRAVAMVPTNPIVATGVWTATDVNGLEAGIQLIT